MKHGIRRKKIRQEKSSEYRTRVGYRHECLLLLNRVKKLKKEKRTILYLDEVNFTKLALPKREWSMKNSNLTVEQEDVYQGYRSVLACMS